MPSRCPERQSQQCFEQMLCSSSWSGAAARSASYAGAGLIHVAALGELDLQRMNVFARVVRSDG